MVQFFFNFQDTPRASRPAKIYIRFANPLDLDLSRCNFTVEAPGLRIFNSRQKYRNVKAKEKVEFELEVTPIRPGPTTIVATFNSNELYNVTGSKKISVIA